jgi:hypothetical protein
LVVLNSEYQLIGMHPFVGITAEFTRFVSRAIETSRPRGDVYWRYFPLSPGERIHSAWEYHPMGGRRAPLIIGEYHGVRMHPFISFQIQNNGEIKANASCTCCSSKRLNPASRFSGDGARHTVKSLIRTMVSSPAYLRGVWRLSGTNSPIRRDVREQTL